MYSKSITVKASLMLSGAAALFYLACEGQPRPPSAEATEPPAQAPGQPSLAQTAGRSPEHGTNVARTRAVTSGMDPVPGGNPALGAEAGAPPNPFAILFDKETRDATWASQYESGIRQVVGAIKGATLQKVECKTTVCYFEVSHDTAQSTNAFEGAFLQGVHQLLKVNTGGHAIGSDPIHLTTMGWITRDGYWSPSSDGTPRPAR